MRGIFGKSKNLEDMSLNIFKTFCPVLDYSDGPCYSAIRYFLDVLKYAPKAMVGNMGWETCSFFIWREAGSLEIHLFGINKLMNLGQKTCIVFYRYGFGRLFFIDNMVRGLRIIRLQGLVN